MNTIALALIGGLAFGALAVALMIPMSFPDKRRALVAAFLSRFAIGFLVPLCHLPIPWPVSGALVGLLVSAPDAAITKAYAPVLGVGLVGGTALGWAVSQLAA
jgi:hypothetical protein